MTLNSSELFFCDSAMLITSKTPLQRLDVCLVATKNYVFAVPMKSIGMYMIVTTIKTHRFFQDKSIPEGVKQIIEEADSISALESAMIGLLEENPIYMYPVAGNSSFKFRGLFGKHTLRIGLDKVRWASFGPTKGASSKEFRAFYGQ